MMKRLFLLIFLTTALFAESKNKVFDITNLQRKPPFFNGEYLKFRISYLGITGGYAEMIVTVDNNDLSNNQIKMQMNAWTTTFVSAFYELKMSLISYCQNETLYNIYYKEDRLEKGRLYYHTLDFDYSNSLINYFEKKRNNKKEYIRTKKLPLDILGFNVLSSFYITRTQKLVPGTIMKVNIFYKKKVHNTEIYVLRKETIRTPFGKLPTIVIIPKMKFKGIIFNTGDMYIYLSDDKYRIPLLMKSELSVGSFKSKLIEGYPVKK